MLFNCGEKKKEDWWQKRRMALVLKMRFFNFWIVKNKVFFFNIYVSWDNILYVYIIIIVALIVECVDLYIGIGL